MMTPRQTLEEIAKQLERAMEPGADRMDVYAAVAGAHTHAVLQAAWLRRAEARAELVVYHEDGRALH